MTLKKTAFHCAVGGHYRIENILPERKESSAKLGNELASISVLAVCNGGDGFSVVVTASSGGGVHKSISPLIKDPQIMIL